MAYSAHVALCWARAGICTSTNFYMPIWCCWPFNSVVNLLVPACFTTVNWGGFSESLMWEVIEDIPMKLPCALCQSRATRKCQNVFTWGSANTKENALKLRISPSLRLFVWRFVDHWFLLPFVFYGYIHPCWPTKTKLGSPPIKQDESMIFKSLIFSDPWS